MRQQLHEAVENRTPPDEAAGSILKTLEKNYDWLHWVVMLHPAVEPLEDQKDEGTQQEKENVPSERHPKNFLSVASEAPVPHVAACYREAEEPHPPAHRGPRVEDPQPAT